MFYIRRTEFILKDVTHAFCNKKMYQKYIYKPSVDRRSFLVRLIVYTYQ